MIVVLSSQKPIWLVKNKNFELHYFLCQLPLYYSLLGSSKDSATIFTKGINGSYLRPVYPCFFDAGIIQFINTRRTALSIATENRQIPSPLALYFGKLKIPAVFSFLSILQVV